MKFYLQITEGVNIYSLTDMVYGSGAELAVELLSTEVPEVVDGVRPKVENVVP